MRKMAPSDGSIYYHEDATADVARMDSAALHGNLADAMKNAIVTVPQPKALNTVTTSTRRLATVFVKKNPRQREEERPGPVSS